MIKNIVILILIVVVAWMSKDSFYITLSNDESKQIEVHKSIFKETAMPIKTVKRDLVQDKEEVPISIDMYLKQNQFYDALSYYLSHSSKKNRQKLEVYLTKLSQQNPKLALEYMDIYLDEEPESSIQKLRITTYISEHEYAKAIELIIATKESYVSEAEEKRLSAQLKETALQYIDALAEQKEYAQLIDFLEEMIAYDSNNSFYSFRLVQLYLELDKTDLAAPLLDTLQYDEVYAQKVKSYIQEISIDETLDESYEYAINLTKYGEHYVVNVLLDGTAFRLMLDTGATYIYIDVDKASMLEVLRSNLRLQTAGGDVQASLCKASTMQVGNLELHDIQVTTAPFKREGIDGLLGMNFLNKFEFFINQEEGVLYLNSK